MKTKKSKHKKVLAGTLGIIIVTILISIFVGVTNNPISKGIATIVAKSYMMEKYAAEPYVLESVKHNPGLGFLRFNATIKSTESIDTHFVVNINCGKVEMDNFDGMVTSGSNTKVRMNDALSKELNQKLVDNLKSAEIQSATGTLNENGGTGNMGHIDLDYYRLDRDFDVYNIDVSVGADISLITSDVSDENLGSILFEISEIFKNNNLRVDYYTLYLKDSESHDMSLVKGNNITMFPAKNISKDNMTEKLTQHKIGWEAEIAKANS